MVTIILVLLTIITAQSKNLLPIRAGIVQLQLGNLAQANYKIPFKVALNDSVYNSMVSVSQVTNLATPNGIVINSVCPNNTISDLQCSINSNSDNQNTIVYMSYVASDIGSLMVGTYQQTFTFSAGSTSMNRTIIFKPLVDNDYINNNNVLNFYFYTFIAGVNSFDPDFSLNIYNTSFDPLTMQISLSINILEMHNKTVTIYFGYLLYDVEKITITLLEGQRLIPGSVADGYIYGIGSIISQNSPPSKRLLQIVPPAKEKAPIIGIPTIDVTDPVTIYPTIIYRNANFTASTTSTTTLATTTTTTITSTSATAKLTEKTGATLVDGTIKPTTSTLTATNMTSSVSSPATFDSTSSRASTSSSLSSTKAQIPRLLITGPPQPSAFIPPQPSSVAQVLRASNNQPNKVILIPKAVDSTLFTRVMQPDGVLDASDNSLAILKQLGVIPTAYQRGKALVGLNDQLFNNLFSTNGFIILTAADDVDAIYTSEVIPVQSQKIASIAPPGTPTGIAAAPASVFYQTVVSNAQPYLVCPKGAIVSVNQYVDYVQQKAVLKCIACQLGMYLDLIRKTCVPFPIITPYSNVCDTIL